MSRLPDPGFWLRQRVLLTGHTGFKGCWAALWLERLGAVVHGISNAPEGAPALFPILSPFRDLTSTIADIRERDMLAKVVASFNPTLVLHMAAQPLVRRSYANPIETLATNVMGTAHVLDALRSSGDLQAILAVTTDKVYANDGHGRPFVESDRLGGHDPYSASKAGTELVVETYRHSFFKPRGVAVATARAGNVIGGGDWSEDRLIPDFWRALHAGKPIMLRYPNATRPWQHVLEPVLGYLLYLEDLATKSDAVPPALNFGPDERDGTMSVSAVIEALTLAFKAGQPWVAEPGPHAAEMPALALDAAMARTTLDWHPRLAVSATIDWTAEWYQRFDAGEDMRAVTTEQLARYEILS